MITLDENNSEHEETVRWKDSGGHWRTIKLVLSAGEPDSALRIRSSSDAYTEVRFRHVQPKGYERIG